MFAPGEEIYSTTNNNGYAERSGTSFATPYVTGVAALLLSEYPNMSPEEIKSAILANVDTIECLTTKCVTGGRLNAYKALSHPFHTLAYADNGSTHTCYCTECDYMVQEAHDWSRYISTGDELRHKVICSVCLSEKYEVHRWVERPLIGDQQCSKCRQTLTGFGPIIVGSIPSEDEDE